MEQGYFWPFIELLGFLALIFCARLASVYEASRQGAKTSELQGLISDSDRLEATNANFSLDDGGGDFSLHDDEPDSRRANTFGRPGLTSVDDIDE
mmetsp:Transcript_11347/g.33648  ORF Transcript_11347/g.33648 Transcript_11347/m.33648 type:complete len:95 (+) Transcript_11347:91-375(+)